MFYLICLILSQGVILSFLNYSRYWPLGGFNADYLPLIGTILTSVGSLATVFVVRALFNLTVREADARAKAEQMDNVNELIKALRAQRHDFVNHVQALYGLIKIKRYEEAARYIETVFGEVKQGSQMLHLGEPQLMSLLTAKMGVADVQGVRLFLRVNPDFRRVPVEAGELNRLVGNLLDNAIHAAAVQASENRWVRVELLSEPERYLIRVTNPGELTSQMHKKVFEAGVTSKGNEHEGLGLYVVKRLAEKNGGQVNYESADGLTSFWVEFLNRM